MFKRILAFAFFAAFAVQAFPQNLTTVSASNITDINGTKLAAGQLCFLITDQQDNPISVSIGGGGQSLRRGYCSPVASGVVTSFTVPTPAATSPAGIYYRVTVKDSSTGQEVLRYSGVTFTGATFNFDNYAPVTLGSFAPLTGNAVSGNLSVSGNVAATGTVTGSNIASGQIVTGAGTTNTVPKYTNGASAIIGNSSITDNGTTVSTSEPVSLGSTLGVTGATTLSTLGVTGVETDTNVNGIRFANGFPGTGATQINNAENDCSTTNCLVIVPATVAAGNGQSLLSKDNVMVLDLRPGSPSAQGTQWRMNVKDTDDGAVRAKMLLIDPLQPSTVMQSGSSSVSFEALSFVEGSMTGRNVLEAINGTEIVDTGTTGSPSNIIGGEFDGSVQGTAANTVSDVRGSTHGCGLSGAGSITNCTSLYAQRPNNTGSGTITNAYAIHAENPTAGTSTNLSILADGNISTNALIVPYSGANGISGIVVGTNAIQPSVALFVRPGVFSFMTGAIQAGVQIAPITNSDATTSGIGLRARADTTAAAFTQALNVGLQVDTPGVGAGSTITEWDGLSISAAPAAGTKCSIKMAGSTSGTTCINTSAVAGGTASVIISAALVTTTAASDTVMVTGMTSTGHCSVTPTNAAAATNIATTFVSAKASNQITVSHTATANMNYDIMCSPI